MSLVLLAFGGTSSMAGEAAKLALGFQGGFSVKDDFVEMELVGSSGLPWEWETVRYRVETRMNGTMGMLDGFDETAFIGSLGPSILFGPKEGCFFLEAGSSPTLLSRERFGRRDLGLWFQFTSHGGIHFKFGDYWTTGYRFQHMSNAGLGSPNPGLDMHMFRIQRRF